MKEPSRIIDISGQAKPSAPIEFNPKLRREVVAMNCLGFVGEAYCHRAALGAFEDGEVFEAIAKKCFEMADAFIEEADSE